MRNKRCWKQRMALAMGAILLASAPAAWAKAEEPEEVAAAGDDAFAECSGLASVTIPDMAVSTGVQTSVAWEEDGQEKIQGETVDFTISSERELKQFAQNVNNGNSYEGKLIKLTKDIKLDGMTNEFTPIGSDYNRAFKGTFDGDGHTISGIDVTDVNGDYFYTGLFGYIDYAGKVCNVTVEDNEFTAKRTVGGIAGLNLGIIDNCHNRETKIGNSSRGGGIVGDNRGTILNCSSTGTVTGAGSQGGIAGESNGKIYNCCNLGEVKNQATYNGYVGGIVGENDETGGEIQNCYNIGRISVTSDSKSIYHGGIAGSAWGIVARSYCSEESDELNFGTTGSGIKDTVKAFPESVMKTEDFVKQMNDNRGSNAGWLEWEIRAEDGILSPQQVKRVNLSWEGRCNIDAADGVSFTYDGEEKRPEITVIYDGQTLVEDIHYEIAYLNNVNAGTAFAEIKGIGKYMGSVMFSFTIDKADISASEPAQPTETGFSACTVTINPSSCTYNGAEKTPEVIVKDGSRTLISGKDYTIRYKDNTNAGTAQVILTGTGNYTGTVQKNFTIEAVDISQASVSLSETSYSYDGTAKTPEVTVEVGRKILTLGTDYSIRYKENTNAGTAQVILTGAGNYTGMVQEDFTIEALDLDETSIMLSKTSYSYDGTAKTPAVTVKAGSRTLASGKDYTIRYKENINAGTAQVVLTGTGSCTGTVQMEFTIAAADISQTSVSLSKASYSYDGKEKKPDVTVKRGNAVLAKNKDYVVSYTNNQMIGKAMVTLTGLGNYNGSVNKTFKIEAKKGTTVTSGAYKYKFTGASEVAFAGLSSTKTTKVTIPAKVTIGGKSFKVTSVEAKALQKKTKVTSVTIGTNVKSIGNNAFNGCKKLNTITIKSKKLTKAGKNAFKGISRTAKIKVPKAKLKDYKKLLKGKGQGKKVKITK